MTKQSDLNMVNAHWRYVESCIRVQGPLRALTEEELIDMVRHHYISAMHHGIKHGREK